MHNSDLEDNTKNNNDMKKSILMWAAAAAIILVSCKENPYMPGPGSNALVPDSMPVAVDPDPTPDPEGIVLPAGTIDVYEAVKIAKALASGSSTDKEYYIKGWVSHFDAKERAKADFEEKFKQYGNDYPHLSARNDGLGKKDFYCYRALGKGGAKLPDHDALKIGDFIVVKCFIQNYSGIPESSGTCSIEVSNTEHFNECFAPGDTIHATCAEAKAAALALPNNNEPTKDIYVIEGYVQQEGYNASVSRGQQIFWIADTPTGGKVFESYYCNVPNGEAVPVGAEVRLIGPIMKYNTTPEMKNGDVEIIEVPN